MLPDTALRLAGFTLAHAVWSVSDTTPEELLCPLAIVQRGTDRQLIRFEAATQVEAIARGRATLAEHAAVLDAWAFAFEGVWRPMEPDAAPDDAVSVEFRGAGMNDAARVALRFERATAAAPFQLLDTPQLVIDGRIVERRADDPDMLALMQGVRSHPTAGELWPSWSGVRGSSG